jgi:ABC-2 type transport system ATP-binding protein
VSKEQVMLHIEGLSKTYGSVAALVDVDLDIAAGQVVGLIGPNGAGKTTLVSIVAGLLTPDAGTVEVAGVDPRRGRAALGLAGQDLAVYPPLTVRENLVLFADLAGLRRRARSNSIEEVLHAVSLDDHADRPVRTLSGGEKRRVHTAISLVHNPQLLVLDEPTAGVDIETRARITRAVRARADNGTAVCYTTHYLPEIEEMADAVTMINEGRVIASGTVEQLLEAHDHAVLQIEFDGPAPTRTLPHPTLAEGTTLRVFTPVPAQALRDLLASLDYDEQARLRAIDIVRPSLESVFLSLTGGLDRLPPLQPKAEVAHVTAS